MFASQPHIVDFEFQVAFAHETRLFNHHVPFHFIALPQFLSQGNPLIYAISPH